MSGGPVDFSNKPVDVDTKKITLVANTTSCVFIDWATKEIMVNTTGFVHNCYRLYEIITDGTGIVSVVSKRAIPRVSAHSKPASLATWLKEKTFNANQVWSDFDLSTVVTIPTNATGIKMLVYVKENGSIVGDGSFAAFRKPDDTAQFRNLKFTVEKVHRRRIESVILELEPLKTDGS